VGEVGVATSSNFNELLCPTHAKGTADGKGQFPELSNLAAPSPLSGNSRIPPPIITGITSAKEEGHGAVSAARVAEIVCVRHEKYPVD
jgi:hypothetical protein